MHVVVAPDKFKGSLTAREVAARVSAGIAAVAPGVPMREVPVADGGDGTVDVLILRTLQTQPMHGWALSERIHAPNLSEVIIRLWENETTWAAYRLERSCISASSSTGA